MPSLFHSSSLQGIYKYLAKSFPDFGSRGIVVGYDTRGQEASGCYSERYLTPLFYSGGHFTTCKPQFLVSFGCILEAVVDEVE